MIIKLIVFQPFKFVTIVYNKSMEIYILPVGRFESDISNSVEILGGERVLRDVVTSF